MWTVRHVDKAIYCWDGLVDLGQSLLIRGPNESETIPNTHGGTGSGLPQVFCFLGPNQPATSAINFFAHMPDCPHVSIS